MKLTITSAVLVTLLCVATLPAFSAAPTTNNLVARSAYSLNTNQFDVTKFPVTITNIDASIVSNLPAGITTNIVISIVSNVITGSNIFPSAINTLLNKTRRVELQATALSGAVASTMFSYYGWVPAIAGTSVAVSPTASTHGAGLLYGATANSAHYLQDSAGTGGVVQTGTASVWDFYVAVTNTADVRVYVGLTDTYGTTLYTIQTPTTQNIALFRYSTNSANWMFITGNGATITTTDTGLAATTSMVRLSMDMNASRIIAYTNSVACCTNSTTLPSAAMTPILLINPLVATAKGLAIYSMNSLQTW